MPHHRNTTGEGTRCHHTARITGWGKYTPDKVLTNFDLEKIVDTSDEWITTRTGIKERRVASEDEPTSFMSVEAARDAMEVAGITADDLDLIIVATSSPDYLLPPVSSQIQDMLGADCGAFSLVAGCTGWLYALTVAQQFHSVRSIQNDLCHRRRDDHKTSQLGRSHHVCPLWRWSWCDNHASISHTNRCYLI